MEPDWSITLVERLDGAAAESSDPWNNAGTGHSALCELNYTPENAGRLDRHQPRPSPSTSSSRCRGSSGRYARGERCAPDVRSFLNPIPHVSFVHGAEQIDYLRSRRDALVAQSAVRDAWSSSTTRDEFASRLPLMAAKRELLRPGRPELDQDGTDIDFGSLSKQLIGYGVRSGA